MANTIAKTPRFRRSVNEPLEGQQGPLAPSYYTFQEEIKNLVLIPLERAQNKVFLKLEYALNC